MKTKGLVLVFLLILVGCAPSPRLNVFWQVSKEVSLKADPALKKALRLYWEARAQRDFKAAFALEAPFFQETVLFSKYQSILINLEKRPLERLEVRRLECTCPFFCRLVLFHKRGSRGIFLNDYWVRVEGRWYHVFRSPFFFPQFSFRR